MRSLDESIEHARAVVARSSSQGLEEAVPAVLAAVAARRSSPRKSTVFAAVATACAMFGVAAFAAPYVDRSALGQMLFRGLSAATGRQLAPESLVRVADPATDVRTRALWNRLSTVATMREAWAMQDGVVMNGATADHGSFYLIALQRNASGPGGILLPDGAFAHPIKMRWFQSRTAAYQLLRSAAMSREQEGRLVSAAASSAH